MRCTDIKVCAISLVVGLSVASVCALGQPIDGSDPAVIREFVHQVYIEGVPYDQVGRLHASPAIAALTAMLKEPGEEEYWSNIVVTLGMLGDDRAVDPLLAFIGRGESGEQLSRSQSVAKTSAVMALGYIVHRTANKKALKYLEEGIFPNTWEARNVQWASGIYPTRADRNSQLAVSSILGLGLSGRPEAVKLLQSIREPAATARIADLRKQIPGIDDICAEALKANAAIASEGMDLYYKRRLSRYKADR